MRQTDRQAEKQNEKMIYDLREERKERQMSKGWGEVGRVVVVMVGDESRFHAL